MKISTIQFGEVEFNQDLILKFSTGLFGFEKLKEFLLIKSDEGLFYWLYSVEQPEIGFPLVGLRVIDANYPDEKDFEAFGIVSFDPDPLKVTVNLKAPVYINQNEKTGFQKILEEGNYLVNYNLFVEKA
jgi:flagellar assembly factor FliW